MRGPKDTALSTQRPVITISAPRSKARAIGPALNIKMNKLSKVIDAADLMSLISVW